MHRCMVSQCGLGARLWPNLLGTSVCHRPPGRSRACLLLSRQLGWDGGMRLLLLQLPQGLLLLKRRGLLLRHALHLLQLLLGRTFLRRWFILGRARSRGQQHQEDAG